MKKGDIFEGKVIRTEFPNKGIIDIEGQKVIVKNALEGQVVRFSINKKKRDKIEGRLLEVIEPSPIEQPAACKHFGICGGCRYQNLSYEQQLDLKKRQVEELIEKSGLSFAIENIYGSSAMGPLMIVGAVPLYNIYSVLVLTFEANEEDGRQGAGKIKQAGINILKNPIIIGIAAGLLWSALKLPMPVILHKAVSSIGGVATPMGLMAMGATFDIKKAFGKIKPTVIAAFIKLVGFVAVFMPLAVAIGFRREKLIAILVMLGSATTVSSYVMAKNMGHEGVVSSSVVMLTTMCSAFTLTGWLYIMKCFGLV